MYHVGTILSLLVVYASLISADSCINDYFQMEKSLLNRTANLANLNSAFFPTNRQASVSVEVTYHFVGKNYTAKFRWHDSTALQLIRGDLLLYFSLFTFNIEIRKVDILLDPMCDDLEHNSSIINDVYENCSHVGPGYELLNNLTVNVSS